MPITEPTFVGDGRVAAVDGLMTLFDRVNAEDRPVWVDMEAPSGWGKTRLAREFYRRIATERQGEPAYWPTSILESLEDAGDLSSRRKRVNPLVKHQPGSLPTFMWWGISCSTRNGTPSLALAEDFGIFRAHAGYLEDAWKKVAQRSPRIMGGLRRFGIVAAEEATMEAGGHALEAALDSAVPGLGLIRWVGGRGKDAYLAARERRLRLVEDGAITANVDDLVDEAVEQIARLAIPGLPTVIFVEDFHDADATLCEFLASLVRRSTAVMIISTSWPGHLTDNIHVTQALERAQQVVIRLGHETKPPPDPFPSQSSLGPLETSALKSIVNHYYCEVEVRTLELIVARYPNPFALELFTQLPRVRRQASGGKLKMTAAEINEAPSRIRGMYRELWDDLPEILREALSFAALGVPHIISAQASASKNWSAPLLLGALGEMSWPTFTGIAAALNLESSSYAWIRGTSSTLRAFSEPDQLTIAAEDDSFTAPHDQFALKVAMASEVGRLTSKHDETSAEDALHLAEVASALHFEGFLNNWQTLAEAIMPAARILESLPRESEQLINLTSRLLEAAGSSNQYSQALIEALELRSAAQRKKGHPELALQDAERLLQIAVGLHDDEVEAFGLGLQADALSSMGRHNEAIIILNSLLTDLLSKSGPDDMDTMYVRNQLGSALGVAGRPNEAIQVFELLRISQERVLELDHPAALATRANLAFAMGLTGRIGEAIRLLEELLADRIRVQGNDHPGTSSIQYTLAHSLNSAGRSSDAAKAYEALLADHTRTLGPDHPDTMTVRNNLAVIYASLGRPVEAVRLLELLLVDATRVFGPDYPLTLVTRDSLAHALNETGRVDEAVQAYVALLADRTRVLGSEHPSTLETRSGLANALQSQGLDNDAIPMFRSLLADRIRIVGPDHQSTMNTRGHLASSLNSSGKASEAADMFEVLLADQARLLGQDHPDTLATRVNFAIVYVSLKRFRKAIDLFETLLIDQTRIYGSDHPKTLINRRNLAASLYYEGRVDDAIKLLEELLADQERILGANHPHTLDTLKSLTFCLLS